MIIEGIIKNHSAYEKLLKLIKANKKNKSIVLEKIEIKGMPFSMQEIFIDAIGKDLRSNIVYASRDSLEVRKYFNTLQIIDLTQEKYTDIIHILNNHGFERVIKVLEPGTYSVLGDRIILWPIGNTHPVKTTYFGDVFESASLFDEIYGNTFTKINTIAIGDIKELITKIGFEQISGRSDYALYTNSCLIFGGDLFDNYESESNINFDFQYPQLFFQRFDLLERDINQKIASGFEILINTKHGESLPKSIQKYLTKDFLNIEAGFVSIKSKILLLTDRELFGTVFLNKETSKLSSDRARKLLSELEGEIDIGDYIVHEDHGIGIYGGLSQEKYQQKIPAGFNKYITNVIYEDYILIKYAEGDELYVPINQINKITKYFGTDNMEPPLTRLGKNEWAVYKKKVTESILIYAKELVGNIAQREVAKSPSIELNDNTLYNDFVRDFPYTDTPDQIRSEKEILTDIQSKKPMNRLIVGDVGFGKTEVAMRAAFVAVQNGYQVAVLCPTTVLTAQHEKVFKERFANFNVKIASMSRFSASNNNKILTDLKSGAVDIVVGTHRLLSNDMQFKNLGLLIIDEEQKFGVKQKEKIKKLKFGVHVLAMSATPIPRTLSMALSSIWDISLIQTPPEGRKSIKTIVKKIDWNEIVKAIQVEIARHGQVYYIHNRVQTIQSTFSKLQTLLPDIRFVYAHGQMETKKLESAIKDFYDNKFDCLVCTTIIENGIDMKNVNTIIVEHAQNFGLAQLYQLRGRVGRSEKQAYSYFFYDGEDIEKKDEESVVEDMNNKGKYIILKAKERRYKDRLKALIEAEELGSGFVIASRDLEIRGAGNLLGKQQHGNINYIGYGLYMQLLANEIERLKVLL